MKISILMSSYMRAHLLNWGLYSLSRHKYPCDIEIIVVNDGIQDETETVCKKYMDRLPIKYIFSGMRNKERTLWRGPCVAYNIAAKAAEGDYIILSCAEMYVLTNVVESIYHGIQKWPNARITSTDNYYDHGAALTHVVKNNGEITDMEMVRRIPRLRNDIPFFMSIPRKAFMDIGGYDEDFADGISFDDDDIMHRLDLYNINPQFVNGTLIHLCHEDFSHGHRMESDKWREVYERNKTLFETRKGTIYRNQNHEWGINK